MFVLGNEAPPAATDARNKKGKLPTTLSFFYILAEFTSKLLPQDKMAV